VSGERKKARLAGAALNPHQRRRVEETLGVAPDTPDRNNAYVELIMALLQQNIKRFFVRRAIFLCRGLFGMWEKKKNY